MRRLLARYGAAGGRWVPVVGRLTWRGQAAALTMSLGLAVAGCGDGASPIAPDAADLSGSYTLRAVNGSPVPWSYQPSGTGGFVTATFIGGSLIIARSAQLSGEIDYTSQVTGRAPISGSIHRTGSVADQADGVRATITQTDQGVPPNTSAWDVAASGDFLTLTRADGVTEGATSWRFERQ